jgi:hypothetical protein
MFALIVAVFATSFSVLPLAWPSDSAIEFVFNKLCGLGILAGGLLSGVSYFL